MRLRCKYSCVYYMGNSHYSNFKWLSWYFKHWNPTYCHCAGRKEFIKPTSLWFKEHSLPNHKTSNESPNKAFLALWLLSPFWIHPKYRQWLSIGQLVGQFTVSVLARMVVDEGERVHAEPDTITLLSSLVAVQATATCSSVSHGLYGL